MKLSIAMCTYNGAQYLQEQLDSIAAQTRLPDELVVCDDRSDDTTEEIITAWASSAPFPVRLYINEKNLGATKNFAKAVELCRGDVIALSDQDDVWYPEKLAVIASVFALRSNAGLVFADAELVDESVRPLGRRILECVSFGRAEQNAVNEGRAFNLLLARNIVTGAALAFRSAYKELILPFPSFPITPGKYMLIHDGWIAIMIAAVAELAFIDRPLIKYRQHRKQQAGTIIPPKTSVLDSDAQASTAWWEGAGESRFDMTKAKEYIAVYERLMAKKDSFPLNKAASRFIAQAPLWELQARHLSSRASLPKGRLSRVPAVLRELLTLRYHRYSNGLFSAAKDLLL